MHAAMKNTVTKQQLFLALLGEVRTIAEHTQDDTNEKLLVICKLLVDAVPYYDWVGFYCVDSSKNELVLGPFACEPTEHKRIPFGKGVCGQAAERRETVISQDVTKELNYLACSPQVKAEIVVPILKRGEFVGVLDIDSHARSAFTAEDKKFLEQVCALVSELF
ncbi:MAG: GAF domain-containing protein [Methanomicrobia archaeon]|nr:GAF domain-containing protein [Methanomicrobia archaeon]